MAEMSEKTVFNAEPGTEIATQLDPMGLRTVLSFDETTGELETDDPVAIEVLTMLAGTPDVAVHKGHSRRKAAVEARDEEKK